MPNSLRPKTTDGGQELLRVHAAIDKELRPNRRLGQQPSSLAGPNRIRQGEPSSYNVNMQQALTEHTFKTHNDGQVLQAYHASSEWPALVETVSLDLPDECVKETQAHGVCKKLASR